MTAHDLVELVARAICVSLHYDPDALEPGNTPYGNNEEVIDGYNAKGEPCHLFWRHFHRHTQAVLSALADAGMVVVRREPDRTLCLAVVRAEYPRWPNSWTESTVDDLIRYHRAMIAAGDIQMAGGDE